MGRKSKTNPDDVVNEAARREAREEGREYRPTTRAKAEEAERLNRGLSMLEEEGYEGEADEG